MSSHFTNLLGQGIEAFQEGKYESATTKLKMILQLDGKNLPALHILGLILAAQKDFTGASNYLNKAAQINPNDPSLQYNLAKALMDAGLNKESLRHHKKATELAPRNREAWLNYGKASSSLGQFTEGLLHYEKAIQIDPNYVEAIVSKGAALKDLGRYTEAVECADKAISLNPHEVSAWSNKGVALRALKLHEEAIRQFNKLLELDPCYADGWFNRGSVLNELKLYSEAIEDYKKAYELNENINWLFGEYIHAKMKICDWSDFDNSLDQISKKTVTGAKVAHPFTLLSLTDNPDLLKRSSEIFSKNNYSAAPSLAHNKKLAKKSKLRIGYFSADFRIHPVAFLIAELFELHDKNQFEIYAFSFVDSTDDMNIRIRNAVHSFINVSNKSDFEISQLARDLSIDIAIDLSGFTEGSRTSIFTYRAAPIQVNFLGYPSTLGSDFIDFIIADKFLIPDNLKQFYAEKIIFLPNSYQPNDRKRMISENQLTKAEFDLPESGFIFCCFCNNYKILPSTFDGWMRILNEVDESVLWLFEDNAIASANLKRAAQLRGVDPNRLIFAKSLPQPNHLARYSLADLFLDSFPYNAHTTASDALWAGLPILTLNGKSFASRVASSLLSAIGLEQLITTTQQDYENLAIDLGKNPQKVVSLKTTLAANRLTAPLFNSRLYTKNIETSYQIIYERYCANEHARDVIVG
jgi:predicted O-linked N-acetylglucosamine transferase (SPINDLY family)